MYSVPRLLTNTLTRQWERAWWRMWTEAGGESDPRIGKVVADMKLEYAEEMKTVSAWMREQTEPGAEDMYEGLPVWVRWKLDTAAQELKDTFATLGY